VHIIQDLGEAYDDDSEAWANHTIKFLGYAPDTVFSSENYGDTYAQHLGCKHKLVDLNRTKIPIAASMIRPNPYKKWDFMKPEIRQYYTRRICVLGAESTGTTTLTKALAEHYTVPWVPEIGRYYTKSILTTNHAWNAHDFTQIAKLQQRYEDTMAGLSDGLIICDTNAFATKIWQRRYIGYDTPEVDELANKSLADLYIVTGDEIPFVQDGIRDGEHIRHDMHKQFISELKSHKLPYIEVRGSVQERLKKATAYIDKTIQLPNKESHE
jgi:HTH-type transcriptional regulator, transcriptional repressor of NAD biosynthesis genes